jgi:hypothetical protein
MTRIAVAILHGIGSQCGTYADATIRRLQANVAGKLPRGEDVSKAVVFRSICWSDVLEHGEETLCDRLSLLPELRWQWLRRLVICWLGDAIGYQAANGVREAYDAVHMRVAEQLLELGDEIGHDTPLCVVAHSFGSVIANNYFYDLNKGGAASGEIGVRLAASPNLVDTTRHSSLASGRTLAALVTLGSPIGLWTMRCPEMCHPLELPARSMKERYPALDSIWLNLCSKSDVLACPLGSINDEYRELVVDLPIQPQCLFMGWHPLSHFLYWKDETVIRSIAATLACVWKDIRQAEEVTDGLRGRLQMQMVS